MSTFTQADLRLRGFVGFEPFTTMDMKHVPDVPGVYVVLATGTPTFLAASPAGPFRGDPSVPVEILTPRWHDATETIYIGKASTSLRARTKAYRAHGLGGNARHWGGRYIWQVTGVDLLLAWVVDPDARQRERTMIAEFEKTFGGLPFANLVH